ncbi:ATPase [Pseudovirgaria hyperparasitica]|uniref:ATPase n=1 Tax=Pseudovirgaria hyperparasitica TaxID=470096 RepID=A0A6A6WDI0_9PEZI|nr:ATPase [Pseudovirgaria hyperparasitica]KAF2760114.1 ATPase [Pseudovirgaria hyperparasitica]
MPSFDNEIDAREGHGGRGASNGTSNGVTDHSKETVKSLKNGTDAPTQAINGDAKESEKPSTQDGEQAVNGNSEDPEKPSAQEGEKAEEKPTEPPVERGSVSEAKSIFRGPKDDDGEYTWSEKAEAEDKAAENETTAKFAVVVRKKKSCDSRKFYEAHSLIIQSALLREALGEVFKDYPGITPSLERFVVYAPFRPFVHRWTAFQAYMARTDLSDAMREHLQILHSILMEEVGDTLNVFRDYVSLGVITYEHLWTIFPPGEVAILVRNGNRISAFEVKESNYIQTRCGPSMEVYQRMVDVDGESDTFGWTESTAIIPGFNGTRKINDLKVYPIKFHEDKDKLEKTLIERGKKFESLRGYQFKQYSGMAVTWNRDEVELHMQTAGRVVIDVKSFDKWSPFAARDIQRMGNIDELKFTEACKEGLLDEMAEEKRASATVATKLTPYHQMVCFPRVRGYSLKTKSWLDFYVENVSDIEWNDKAFESLVLPEDQKEMILACTEAQVDNKGDGFDDVVKGKGEGLIMLASGPPGVGKTLTAEAVAEHLRAPLHMLTSGDLGSSAGDLEDQLQSVLDMVGRWNAILLIDECDVFLEARSVHDLERNRVVSIFLRTLEYYQGILFMTTNRVKEIDQAFQSRIHVSIEYPALTKDSRRQIWSNFLRKSESLAGFSDHDLDELATADLNGRQIKNVLKTSQLLASRRKEKLSRKFVDTVLKVESLRPEASHIYM